MPSPAGTPPVLLLRVLGAAGLYRAARETGPVPVQPRRLALLAYLAVARPRGFHRRDTLLALLWSDVPQSQARHALRNALSALRQSLGAEAVLTSGDELVGLDFSRLACDLHQLEADLDAGAIETALDRFAELLGGFHVSEAPGFDDWVDRERLRLRERILGAGLAALEEAHRMGEVDRALRLAQLAGALDPDDERVFRRRLELLAASGDRAGALRSYDAFAARLARDHDAAPAEETERLVAAIRGAGPAPPARLELALLPTLDLSAGGSLEHVAAALDRELAARLGGMIDLRLCPPGLVGRHRDPSRDPAAIGRRLEADVVVDLRLTERPGTEEVELSYDAGDLRGERPAVRGRLAGTPGELPGLAATIASRLAEGLGLAAVAAPTRPAADQLAYVLYIRGTYLFLRAAHGGHPEVLDQSRQLFEQSLARDPGFAPAIAGLANYYAVAAARGVLRPFAEHFDRAIALSREALELDPSLAIPHVHFGVQALYLEGDWDRAEHEWSAAVRLDPTYAEAFRFRGILRAASGRRADALDDLREAVRLEPDMAIYRNSLGDAYLSFGLYEAAIVELRAAVALDPGYLAARERLIRCLERAHRFDEAVAEREAGNGPGAGPFVRAHRDFGVPGYLRCRTDELRQLLADGEARLESGPPAGPGDLFNPPQLRLALGYAELGQWEDVIRLEEHAALRFPAWRRWFAGRPELARAPLRRDLP